MSKFKQITLFSSVLNKEDLEVQAKKYKQPQNQKEVKKQEMNLDVVTL